MAGVVQRRIDDLRSKVFELHKARDAAQDDKNGLLKRRSKAITNRAAFGTEPRPSTHKYSLRASRKMPKKVYNAAMQKTKSKFADRYSKKRHLLNADVSDTFKAVVMVQRYIGHITEKIVSLSQESGEEYNSEAWNTIVYDKLDLIERKGLRRPGPGEARGNKAKPKKAARRASAAPAPPTPPMGDYELANFHVLEVKHFKGMWSVVCGQMKGEAEVRGDGKFEMHQKNYQGAAGGWSATGCQIAGDGELKTFVTDIDGEPWICTRADLEPAGKSVVIWESEGKPQSIWTRTKAPQWGAAKAQVKPKAKAKTQVRRRISEPTTPQSESHVASAGDVLQAASPTPSPVEWYTEIREGRLMWTDGISAVPAEERVTDDNRQKTKMQF